MSNNESDDHRSGIRTYLVTFPTGEEQLTIDVVFAGASLRVPGAYVSRLRAMLQRVEREHPTLCGSDAGVDDIKKVDVMGGVSDPSKAQFN